MTASDPTARWLTEADVATLIDLDAAIAAVDAALRSEARGAARNMLKTHVQWGGAHTLHALGAAWPDAGVVGTKTWAHTVDGASPLLLLFDAEDGAPRAVIEAFALGQLRTAAVSGVATRCLARADADRLAMIGSGRQALAQVAAVAAVRPLRAVDVFSPTAAHREAFAARVSAVLGIAARAVASVRAAVADAPIVTLATRAREPFLDADMLAPGAHVNAIGAITPERAELGADVCGRCALVVADSVPTAQRLSRELRNHFDAAADGWSGVVPLSRVVAGEAGRGSAPDVTLFKAMGVGVADVAIGVEVLARARRTERGRPIAPPGKVEIDWRTRR